MSTKSRAQLLADITALLADNGTGDITPADVRQLLTDIADSNFNPTSDGAAAGFTQVATHAALPVTLGDPAVGALYYVQNSTGSYWTFNKKPSGLWRRIANIGALSDWERAGELEDVLPGLVTQAEAEAGTLATVRTWTPERVKQAIAALLPALHAATHRSGGTDALKLDDLAAPDDNTDLDATTARHGLLPKLPGGTTAFLRADGGFAVPPGERFIHTQPTPSALWILNHNFGRPVSTYVLDAAGNEVEAEISNPSNNQARAAFTLPIAGSAICQ